MERRTRLPRFAPWAVLVLLGLAGCTDAITVHPVARALDPAPDVPALAGRWVHRIDDRVDAELRFSGADARGQRCRSLEVTREIDGEAERIADEVCLLELDGYLLAELRSPGYPAFFRQVLVRVDEDRIELCVGVPVWNGLKVLAERGAVGYSLDGIEHTSREGSTDELMVVIAGTEDMRDFLATALPELAAACDEGPAGDGDPFVWYVFEKVRPEDEPPEAQTESE